MELRAVLDGQVQQAGREPIIRPLRVREGSKETTDQELQIQSSVVFTSSDLSAGKSDRPAKLWDASITNFVKAGNLCFNWSRAKQSLITSSRREGKTQSSAPHHSSSPDIVSRCSFSNDGNLCLLLPQNEQSRSIRSLDWRRKDLLPKLEMLFLHTQLFQALSASAALKTRSSLAMRSSPWRLFKSLN
ncbi:uncharacterized protein LOC135611065 isoform X2 [Musa acuminata AAA Group]|uniref:uncharacterized protein LOC135611065 isoform X2 n=1 Tax=Musa acuminata AAA Group TaxID=214697 RepID=UPI0031E416AB